MPSLMALNQQVILITSAPIRAGRFVRALFPVCIVRVLHNPTFDMLLDNSVPLFELLGALCCGQVLGRTSSP